MAPLDVAAVDFRRFEAADIEAVLRLHHVALEAAAAHAGCGPWDDDLSTIETVYIETGGEFLVGVLGSEIVAMGALRPVNPTVAELKRMRVTPELQGRGLGRRLLALLEETATARGFTELELDTADSMIAARRLYDGAGYREVRRALGPGSFELVFMRKRLAQ